MEQTGGSLDVTVLIKRAAELYDDPATGLQATAPQAATNFFLSGAQWMNQALGVVRGRNSLMKPVSYQLLGLFKYTTSVGVGLFFLWLAWRLGRWDFLGLVPLGFLAVDSQLVFLFPALLEGAPSPLAHALRLSHRAGGPILVMAGLIPLWSVALFGGFVGQGFLRSWCLSCLAVVLWYDHVCRSDSAAHGAA